MSNWIKNWLMDREQRVVINGHFSSWSKVLSGVPQGSVLGPLLFTLYINDIDQDVTSSLFKFADDTKCFSEVTSQLDIAALREDMRKISDWSEDWQMLFNTDKCKVMHIGNKNCGADYKMGDIPLAVVEEERDLGIIVQNDLKVSKQCAKVAATGNRILGMIYRSFNYKSKDIILQLYKSLVRPHLEYCIQAWCPFLQKDIDLLEKVQHRATRMIDNFRTMTYEDRLTTLGLTTLETRRLRVTLYILLRS